MVGSKRVATREVAYSGGIETGAVPLQSRGLKPVPSTSSRSSSSSNSKTEEAEERQRPSTARLVVTHSR